MRKTVQKHIMKKPLFALALIAFGIGIALYTNASFKEGLEDKTTADKTASATNSIMGNADIKKLLGSKEIQSLISGITAPSASVPSATETNTVEPNIVQPKM